MLTGKELLSKVQELPSMTDPYQITKEIHILHTKDDWDYTFITDEYGTVTIVYTEGLENMTGKTTSIDIPKDCIAHFVNALDQLK